MQPTDIAHLITLGAPTVSPDGRTAVVAATRPDLDENEYRSQLWSVALDASSPPRRLTHGVRDSAPRFSPDGRWLAFLRAEPEGKPQLHVLPTAGGDSRALTDLAGGAGAPAWSPDSASIAFTARVPEEGRYGQDEKVTPDKEPPRRITGLQYRLDGVGFLIDRRSHVFVVDVVEADEPNPPRQVSDGDFDDADVTWSPDGTWLAFVSARHDRREHELNNDVFLIRPDGSDRRQLTDTALILGRPAFTADGSTLLVQGSDPGPTRTRWFARNPGLFTVGVDGGRPERLTDAEAHQLVETRFVVEPTRALVLLENHGAIDLAAVPLDGGEPAVLAGGPRQLIGVDTAGDTIVVT
ncbi:MAG: S9 family peptidase, partial [Jatrophihabitantaceae bacterium]